VCELTFQNKNAHICTNICQNGIINIYIVNEDLKKGGKKEEYVDIILSFGGLD
jgi:hypothetical protein